MDIKSIAKLGRSKDIVMTLLKYGFEDLVQRLDIPGVKILQKVKAAHQGLGTYERIRRVLEDLGPTFVKFGQIMSLRPDLLPQPLILELSKLQDSVSPVPLEEIHRVVKKGLGREPEDLFSIFDAEPLAAGSIAQVHRGVLRKEGAIVCIKVQRPGIRRKIEADLDILRMVCQRLHESSEDLRAYDLPNLVRTTRRYLLREIDFTLEAGNMKIARSYMGDEPDIYIPEVYDGYYSEQVLVMEYIQGTKLRDMTPDALEDPRALARQGLRTAIKQILGDGFFHADPHPGNLLVSEEKGLCLLDWGMIGRLTERDRYRLIDLLKAMVDKDSEAMVSALLRIGSADGPVDESNLERELLDILDSYFAVPVKALNVGQLLTAITELLRVYHLRLPPDLVIMVKALVTAEGTARQIYPDLNVIGEAESYVTRMTKERYRPEILWRHFRRALATILVSQREVPRRLSQLLTKIDRGDLSVRFRHENLRDLMHTIENSSNRLSFSIIIASLIVGSSMIITTGIGPLLFGFPALGVIGYIISGLLGLWLVITILHKRNY